MKKLIVGAMLLAAGTAYAYCRTGYLTYESECRGQFKSCHYNVMGEEYERSVSCYSVCPINITVCG